MEEYLEVGPLLRVDRCIAVKVSYDDKVNIYTPHECSNKLAFIGAFIEEDECTSMYVMDDFNTDISDRKSLLGGLLVEFCNDNKLLLTSICQKTAIQCKTQ